MFGALSFLQCRKVSRYQPFIYLNPWHCGLCLTICYFKFTDFTLPIHILTYNPSPLWVKLGTKMVYGVICEVNIILILISINLTINSYNFKILR